MADILSQEEIDALLSDLITEKSTSLSFSRTRSHRIECGFASHGVFPSVGTLVDNITGINGVIG